MTEENEQPKKLEKWGYEFPLEFPLCPNCGSANRLSKVVGDGLKADGRALESTIYTLHAQNINFADLRKQGLTMPIIQLVFDVCADCGTYWVIGVGYVEAMPQAQKQQPKFDPNARN